MRYLLDTHVLYWMIADTTQLSKKVKPLLEDLNNELFISDMSLFELTIKSSIGKLNYKSGLNDLFDDINGLSLKTLHLQQQHLLIYQTLPLHHRDPFDRLLLAQAKTEGLAIISRDAEFLKYDVDVIW